MGVWQILVCSCWLWALVDGPLMALLAPLVLLIVPLATRSAVPLSASDVAALWALNMVGTVMVLTVAVILPPLLVIRALRIAFFAWSRVRRWLASFFSHADHRPRSSCRHALGLLLTPLCLLYCVCSEVCLLPGVGLLLLLEKLMLLLGGEWHAAPNPSTAPNRIPVVLVHGSGINECQWVVTRYMLQMHGYDVVSCNYLLGDFFQTAPRPDCDVPDFAATTAAFIDRVAQQRKCEEVHHTHIHSHARLVSLSTSLILCACCYCRLGLR
jgi:hypothetical protein